MIKFPELDLFTRRFLLFYLLKGGVSFAFGPKSMSALKMALGDRNNRLFALALAAMATSNHTLKNKLNNKLGPKLSSFLAGSISSLWLTVIPQQSVSETISSLIFVRTLHYGIRAMIYKRRLVLDSEKRHFPVTLRKFPAVLEPLQRLIHNYGPQIIWIYISAHINIGLFVFPKDLPSSLRNSLWKAASHPQRYGQSYYKKLLPEFANLIIYLSKLPRTYPLNFIPIGKSTKEHLQDMIAGGAVDTPIIKKIIDLNLVLPNNLRHDRLVCACFHPATSSCAVGAFTTTELIMKNLFGTYLFLNSIGVISRIYTAIILKLKGKHDHSKKSMSISVLRWLFNSLRSTFTIATYMGLISYSMCMLRRIFGERLWIYAVAGIGGTPAIVFDKKGRLQELNNYCVSKLFQSYMILLYKGGLLKYTRNVEALIMMPTFGALALMLNNFDYAVVGIAKPILNWFFCIKDQK